QTGDKRYEAIKAVVTTPQTSSGAFVAMVEENEIRANLSPFERGRISVVAVGQGAFESVEQAVNILFASVSKAKRSKVRSFAAIFEELGDLLRYPENLSERQGLRLAAAIRSGQGPKLRAALSKASSENAWDEWASVEPVLELSEAEPKSGRAGGRPRKATGITAQVVEVQHLATGHVVSREMDRRGTLFRIEGPELNDEQAANVMEAIRLSMGPEN
ncbi:MAG: chromosome partitioning protein ParB, partial [Pseudomonadota bacterium]